MPDVITPDGESLVNQIDLQTKVNDLEKSFEKKIEDSKRDLVTILGVFVSFITFTSIDFQILKNVNDISDYIALTFLLLSAMLLFVFGLKNLTAEELAKDFYKKPLFIVIEGLLLLSFAFYIIPRISESSIHTRQQNYRFFYSQ